MRSVGSGIMLTMLRSTTRVSDRAPWKLGFVALAYLDLVLTLYAVQSGFTEMNPVMLRLLASPGELFLVKVVVPPLIALTVPAMLLLPSVLLMVLVTGWNLASLLQLV